MHFDANGNKRVLADAGFPAYQRMQLMCAADCYVSARRGAGWDPLAAEAVACGRMLLAPAWGSQQALVQGFGLAVAHRMVPSNEPGHGQRWAEADADSLIAQMRAASEGRQILLANARHKAARFAQENPLDASTPYARKEIDLDDDALEVEKNEAAREGREAKTTRTLTRNLGEALMAFIEEEADREEAYLEGLAKNSAASSAGVPDSSAG